VTSCKFFVEGSGTKYVHEATRYERGNHQRCNHQISTELNDSIAANQTIKATITYRVMRGFAIKRVRDE